MKLYMGWGCTLLLYFYVPLALIGLLLLYRKFKPRKTRAWAVPLYVLVAYAIPLGDVTLHSWSMAKVCPKAGLHIYRTVVVDGFMPGGEGDIKRGYRFMESHSGTDGTVTRWEKTTAGINRLDNVPAKSEWEERIDGPEPDSKFGVTVTHEYIQHRMTKEIIAERWRFSAWRGWIDAWIGSLIDNSPGGCDGGALILRAYIDNILISSERK